MSHLFVNLHHFENHHGASEELKTLAASIRKDNGHRDPVAWMAVADEAEACGIYVGCFRNYIEECF